MPEGTVPVLAIRARHHRPLRLRRSCPSPATGWGRARRRRSAEHTGSRPSSSLPASSSRSEQEVGRALAHRRALGQGSGLPVLRKAALLSRSACWRSSAPSCSRQGRSSCQSCSTGAGCCSAACSWPSPATRMGHFLREHARRLRARFQQYWAVHGLGRADPASRPARCWRHRRDVPRRVRPPRQSVPPFLAVFIALRGSYRLHGPRAPPADWGELTPNLGWLVAGSDGGSRAGQRRAARRQKYAGRRHPERHRVRVQSYAVLVARVPLFMFRPCRRRCCEAGPPRAAWGLCDDCRQGFRRLMQVVRRRRPGRWSCWPPRSARPSSGSCSAPRSAGAR